MRFFHCRINLDSIACRRLVVKINYTDLYMTTLALQDSRLLKTRCLINGQWVYASSGMQLAVRNPATGAIICNVPDVGSDQTEEAIVAADQAMAGWKSLTAEVRAQIMHRWYELMLDHQDDLALIMTSEQGKPLAEAKGEIAYAASYIQWFAEESRRIYGEVIPSPWHDKRIIVTREPLGVCAAITPWNFPAAMITTQGGTSACRRLHHCRQAGQPDAAFSAGHGRTGAASRSSSRCI